MKLKTYAVCASVMFSTLLAVAVPTRSVAAAGRSKPASAPTAAPTEGRPVQPPATSDLGEWVGVYPIGCSKPGMPLEFHVVIQDASGTSLIVGDGHMTCYRLHGIAKAAGPNRVNIYYESEALGCGWQKNGRAISQPLSFSKGDLLLSLERGAKGYIPHWEALTPDLPCDQSVYREDQGTTEDGRKLEGPYWGKGFFNRVSPGGICGYDLQYPVFYHINQQIIATVNSAIRTAAGVPSDEELKQCDEAQGREPPAEQGPRYCKSAQGVAWLNGDRIGSVEIELSDLWPCARTPTQEGTFSSRGLTFDSQTGRFFKYNDLFRPESRGQVDKLIYDSLAGKMKRAGLDYPWAQFLKDKKETYEFCLWPKTFDRWAVTLKILDFPDEWFTERVASHGGLEPELPLDQLKGYVNPDGPLALLLSRAPVPGQSNSK